MFSSQILFRPIIASSKIPHSKAWKGLFRYSIAVTFRRSLCQFSEKTTLFDGEMLEKCEAGDLLIYGNHMDEPHSDPPIASASRLGVIHVSIVVNKSHVIESCWAAGVVIHTLDESIETIEPDYVEFYQVIASNSTKIKAVEVAKSLLGLPMSDLFLDNMIDSQGRKSLYCSQLVTESYKNTEVSFPPYTLNYGEGKNLEHWKEYFKRRGNCDVPMNEPGSHPFQIRKSPNLRYIGKLDINRPIGYVKKRRSNTDSDPNSKL